MAEDNNMISLYLENGEEVKFEVLDVIEYNSETYVVLLPEDDEEGEVVILKAESLDEETDQYIGVEDEDTLNTVFEMFKERAKDIFDFED